MIRFLRNHWGYVSVASAILALAIGINVFVFSVVNALWLRPLPVADPERVVTILQSGSTVTSLDSPALRAFSGPVAGQVVTTGLNEAFKLRIAFPQLADPIETLSVTPLYFSVLGVSVRGRAFTEADERIGADVVGIISDRLWSQAFGRRPDTIGSVIEATPRPIRIVGIAPPGFEGARRGERAELWVPAQTARDLAPEDRQLDAPSMMIFARLEPGQTIAALEQRFRELRSLPNSSQLRPAAAPTFAPLTQVFGSSDSPSILIRETGTVTVVFGLSLLVLLGGCATIAALVLTHYERRRSELVIKASLGASRGRLARGLLAELMLVTLGGSVGAIIVGQVGLSALPALNLPGGVNIGRLDLSLDWRLCAMALVATLITLATATAVPIWKMTQGRLASEISNRSATATAGSLRTRRRLLSLQVCATTVVLVASVLFVRTVLHSFRFAAGFEIDRTVFVTVQEKPAFLSTGSDPIAVGQARRTELTSLLEQLPSVRAVAGGASPVGGAMLSSSQILRTISVAGREERLFVGVLAGTPNLLPTLGVPLLAGRALDRSDVTSGAPIPVVITRSLAERLWATGGALGQVFSIREMRSASYVVVGIADNFAFGTLASPVAGVVVTAKGDGDFRASNLVVQTDDPEGVVLAVPDHLRGRVVSAVTGREIVGRDIAQQRLGAWAFSGFGLVALLLGTGGVFGLVAYLAQTRRREFGVRMALGASLSDVVHNAVLAALGPVTIGVSMGLLCGALVSRAFVALLVGIDALDPLTYLGVALIMMLPAALAAWGAAWRLRSLMPSEALRRG